MKKNALLPLLTVCLGLVSSVRAEFVLWVSDNGPKGTVAGSDGVVRGVFYPPSSTNGTPFVDQGFVDLLQSAGHNVTRYNPNSTSLSLDDVPLINSYDVIILGAALNSGPFNLNARGAKWNTHITRPMLITKSTLIRRDRMGYLLDNKEFDCAADASTTMSGKFTLAQPGHPIFRGINRTTVNGAAVMDAHALLRVASPLNNRGASVQYYKLLIDGVDQSIANAVETGGRVLATIDFNPLDPGVNIPAGQAPAVNPAYQATGYAIVEWPLGTVVRTTQTTGETNASYRLLFACGTRDASGSVTASPNPQAGAMDLSEEGRRMFLNAVLHASAQDPSRVIRSAWGEWDYKQYLFGGIGNLVLSNQTASSFTAWIATNDVDVVNNTTLTKGSDGVIEPAGRPTIYQEFAALDLSREGQKVTASFDLKFNNALAWSDQFVRFGFGNTNNNSSFYLKIDSGLGGGTTLGWRSDSTMTDTNGLTVWAPTFDPAGNLAAATILNYPVIGPSGGFVSGNYGHFLNSGSFGARYPEPITAYPNGVGLGVEGTLDVIHTISMSMERVQGGLKIVGTWSNSAGADFLVSGYVSPYVDAPAPASHGALDQIGCLGFNLMNNDLFTNGYAGGTFSVSNFRFVYDNPPIQTYRILSIENDPLAAIVTLTWESKPGGLYTVETSTDLVNWTDTEWTNVASQGETTSVVIFPDPGFYRIRKQ